MPKKNLPYYLHVNMFVIKKNRKLPPEEHSPPITIKRGKHKKVDEAFEVKGKGEWQMVYDPLTPVLPCGARLVMVCDNYEKVK